MKRIFNIIEIKYGIQIVAFGLIPIAITLLITELYLRPELCYDSFVLATKQNPYMFDSKYLIYYLTSGFAHLTLSVLVIWQFKQIIYSNTSFWKITIGKRVRIFIVVISCFLVYLLDVLHLDLAFVSHDRIYFILSKSYYYQAYFKMFPSDFFNSILNFDFFYIFSILPFSLISVALIVMTFGSFAMGKTVQEFIIGSKGRTEDLIKSTAKFSQKFKDIIFLLSIVLATSTIATVLLFQLPVPLIEEGAGRNIYQGDSFAYGIKWGVIFSFTLLFLCIYPYYKMQKTVTQHIQKIRIKNDPVLEEWLSNNGTTFSFVSNIKFLTSIASPSIAGLLTTILSGSI